MKCWVQSASTWCRSETNTETDVRLLLDWMGHLASPPIHFMNSINEIALEPAQRRDILNHHLYKEMDISLGSLWRRKQFTAINLPVCVAGVSWNFFEAMNNLQEN